MTVKELVKRSAKQIGWFDSEYLLARAMGKNREFIIANPDKKVFIYQRLFFKKSVKRRLKGIPAAYLIGRQEFYGLSFFVNKHVMVPRPGTEMLVDGAILALRNSFSDNHLIIDVGTGSGCVAIAIAKKIQRLFGGENISLSATEISKRALRVAKINAKKHNANIKFLHGDLLNPIINNLTKEPLDNKSIIITANLPYLIKETVEKENPPRREPMIALLGGQDGLRLYEKLLKQIKLLVANNRPPIAIFFEINHNQAEPIKKMVRQYLPDFDISFRPDLNGDLRVAVITYRQSTSAR